MVMTASTTSASTYSASITLASVTAWTFTHSEDHRCEVPSMPREERTEWCRLAVMPHSARSCTENALYRALTRKMIFRGRRELNQWA